MAGGFRRDGGREIMAARTRPGARGARGSWPPPRPSCPWSRARRAYTNERTSQSSRSSSCGPSAYPPYSSFRRRLSKVSLPGHLSPARISAAKLDPAMRHGLWLCRSFGESPPKSESSSSCLPVARAEGLRAYQPTTPIWHVRGRDPARSKLRRADAASASPASGTTG